MSYINKHGEDIFNLLLGDGWGEGDLITPILPPEATEPTIQFLEVIGSPNIEEIKAIDSEERLISISVKLSLDIHFFMDKHDWYGYEDDEDFETEDSDWNEWTVWCSANREILCEFELVYNLPKSEILSIDRKYTA